jgi:sec-independent protein translocase protein TatA
MEPTLAFFSNMGLPELLVILFIILLLFGGAKLPALARSLGSSVSEFKKGAREGEEEAKQEAAAAAAKDATPPPAEKK